MKFLSYRLINLSLRAVTILLKFILSILVIKKLSIDDYGIFGIFQSTVILVTFILGFDFYTYSSREILKKGALPFNFYFGNQLFFYLFTYALVIPCCYLLTRFGIIESNHFFLFIFILVFEHLSQELYRVLIIINKTFVATVALFIRSGIWIIFLYLFWANNLLETNITSLLVLWAIGALVSVFLGFRFINFQRIKKFDFKWILVGVKISFPFFIGTILYKCIEFSGRYFLKFYFTEEEVGVYTFFTSIANILFVFVQTIVIIEIYPKLLGFNGNKIEFFKVFQVFKKQLIQYTILGFILSLISIYPLLWFLDKTVLMDNIFSYFILLFAMFVFLCSFIYHYALYAFKRDLDILKATIVSFSFCIILSFILIPVLGILGASLAQFLSFLVMLVVKFIYWKKHKPKL